MIFSCIEKVSPKKKKEKGEEMKKKSTIWTLTLALVFVLASSLLLTACGKKYAVTFEVEKATVEVEGYKKLPEKVKDGEELKIKITPDDGYEVASVKVTVMTDNGESTSNIRASGGVYIVTVKGSDVKITVAVKEALDSVVVTAPTKTTYFSGDQVDPAGMTVTAKYKTGKEETVAEGEYSVKYNSGNAFAMGDTSFCVTYGGKDSNAITVPVVKTKIVIDTIGGIMPTEYVDALKANTEIGDVTSDATSVSFTYDKALTSDIALPETVIKNYESDPDVYMFDYWAKRVLNDKGETVYGATVEKIDSSVVTSMTVGAKYDMRFVEVSAIHLENREIGGKEGKETAPLLIINGKFKAATEAYLYLYEGNKPTVELKGTTVKGTLNQEFELIFDCRDMLNDVKNEDGNTVKLEGKWMDIKFKALLGEEEEVQQINLTKYADDFVDVGEQIVNGGYMWSYRTHTPDDTNEVNLKLVYETAPDYIVDYVNLVVGKFTPAATETEPSPAEIDVPVLVVTGDYLKGDTTADAAKTALETASKDLSVMNAWNDVCVKKEVIVEADMSFTIKMFMSADVATGKTVFMHFGNGNLETARINKDVKFEIGEKEYSLFIDRVWNSNLVSIKVDSLQAKKVTKDNATFEATADKAYLVINGTFGSSYDTEEKAIAAVKDLFPYLDYQNDPNDGHATNTDWGDKTVLSYGVDASTDGEGNEVPAVPATMFIEVDMAQGTYKLKVDITSAGAGNILFFHTSDSANLALAAAEGAEPITVGTKKYEFFDGKKFNDNWQHELLFVKVTEVTPAA